MTQGVTTLTMGVAMPASGINMNAGQKNNIKMSDIFWVISLIFISARYNLLR